MTEANYIAGVCRQNPLSETVDWLIQSSDDYYYADRHVKLPPDGIPTHAACSAGLALLLHWGDELEEIRNRGISREGPILVIDQAWLDGTPGAPSPHVILGLAKRGGVLHPLGASGKAMPPGASPIENLLSSAMRPISVTRIEPDKELESDGCWLFQLAAPFSDSLRND